LIVGGPVSAITKVAKAAVVLEPGKYNQSDLAKMISRQLLAAVHGDEKKTFRKLITVDQIAKFLPAGYSEVVRVESQGRERAVSS
jgi:hypothetical protein